MKKKEKDKQEEADKETKASELETSRIYFLMMMTCFQLTQNLKMKLRIYQKKLNKN